jgi:hypothetical protein
VAAVSSRQRTCPAVCPLVILRRNQCSFTLFKNVDKKSNVK